MTDYSDIDAHIGRYSDAFDFYMDEGEMPPYMPPDDTLGGYMKTIIDKNPQIDGSDPVWVDVLKSNLLGYIGKQVTMYADVQRETEQELKIIDEFEKADIEKKRRMWGPVCKSIQAKYTQYDVDIPGFTRQFATADRDAVFSAMISDWRAAAMRHCVNRQNRLHEESKRRWELSMSEIAGVDYEERRRIADMTFKYPALQEIVDIIGRERDSADTEDNIIYTFLPTGVRTGLPSEDIDSIENGDNIHRSLPVEFAMPDDLFFKRFACKELQQLVPPRQRKPKKTEEHHPKPRPKKGPIIVGIDTSGSMHGKPEEVAKALLIELVKMARRDCRSCYLITFSVRVKTVDLGRSANLLRLKDFLDTHFTGGTNEQLLIVEALRLLETKEYEMADVLVISDFIFNSPNSNEVKRIEKAKLSGTKFYGLQINSTSQVFNTVLDKKWYVNLRN